jgi:hypothetical protein
MVLPQRTVSVMLVVLRPLLRQQTSRAVPLGQLAKQARKWL